MISYSKSVVRAYKTSCNSDEVDKLLEAASISVSKALKNIIETRGAHVHSNRYSDADIDRLSSIDLMCKSNDKEFSNLFELLFIEAYNKTRKKWISTIKQNNLTIEKLLDSYCLSLINAITNGDKIIYPPNIKLD